MLGCVLHAGRAPVTDDAPTVAATTAAGDSSRKAMGTPEPLSSLGNEQHDNKSAAGDSSPNPMDVLSGSFNGDTGNKISQTQHQHLSNARLPHTSNMQDKAESASMGSVEIGASGPEEPQQPQQTLLGAIPDERTEFQRKSAVRNSIRTKLSQFAGSTHNYSNISSGISNNQSSDSSNNQSSPNSKTNGSSSSSSSSQSDKGNGLSFANNTQGQSKTSSDALASTDGQSGSLSHQSIDSSSNATGNRSVDTSNSATGNSSLSPDGSLEPSSTSGSDSTASQDTDRKSQLPSMDSSDSSDRDQAGGHELRGQGPRPSAVLAPRSSFRGRRPGRGGAMSRGRGGAMSRGRGAGRGGMTGWGASGSLTPPPFNGSQPQGYPGPVPPVAPRHFGGEGPYLIPQINLPSSQDHVQGELSSVFIPSPIVNDASLSAHLRPAQKSTCIVQCTFL